VPVTATEQAHGVATSRPSRAAGRRHRHQLSDPRHHRHFFFLPRVMALNATQAAQGSPAGACGGSGRSGARRRFEGGVAFGPRGLRTEPFRLTLAGIFMVRFLRFDEARCG